MWSPSFHAWYNNDRNLDYVTFHLPNHIWEEPQRSQMVVRIPNDPYHRNVNHLKDPNINKEITTYFRKNMFVGMDAHKKFSQIAMIDKKAKVIFNEKIKNEPRIIRRFFRSSVYENTKIVSRNDRFITFTIIS